MGMSEKPVNPSDEPLDMGHNDCHICDEARELAEITEPICPAISSPRVSVGNIIEGEVAPLVGENKQLREHIEGWTAKARELEDELLWVKARVAVLEKKDKEKP